MSQTSQLSQSSTKKRIQKPRTTLAEIFESGAFNMNNLDIKRLFETHGDDWMNHVKLIFNKTKTASVKSQCCALKLDKKSGETSQCSRNAKSGECFCGMHNKIHGAKNNQAIDMGCFDEFEFKWQQFGKVDATGDKQEASWIAKYRKRQSMKVKRAKKSFKAPTLPKNQTFEEYKAEQLKKMEHRLNKKKKELSINDSESVSNSVDIQQDSDNEWE